MQLLVLEEDRGGPFLVDGVDSRSSMLMNLASFREVYWVWE